jgi:hypothetical protein
LVRIQSGSLLAQSNCAIFYLKAALEAGFREKAFQTASIQIKENGDLFGDLFGDLPLKVTMNLHTCFVEVERAVFNLKNAVWYECQTKTFHSFLV